MNTILSVGIDIGTGSIKAVATNKNGDVIANDQLYYPPNAGIITERDPYTIWNTFTSLLASFLKKLTNQPNTITLSSCMHSLILVDKNDEPLTPMISWADNRSHQIALDLRHNSLANSLYSETGTPIHAMSPLCKIIWFKQNQPQLFNKTAKFISIKEFIWFKLFNSYQVDYSIASATGLFNIKTLNWNNNSLNLAGISGQHLSQIVSTSYSKTTSSSFSLDYLKDQTICIGSSDGCLANLGSGAIQDGEIALTIGTSGAVRVTSSTPIENFKDMTFNYVLNENTFISGGPVNNGGNIIQWLIRTFINEKDPSEKDYSFLFDEINKVPPGAEGLLFLPYLNGERAPVWDEGATGSYIGIKSSHTPAHFLRAGVEGVCFALNQLIIQIDRNKTGHLHVSGGFIRSDAWLQILADISGKKLFISENADSSALGASFMGLISQGFIKEYQEISGTPVKVVTPNKNNHDLYKEYFDVFVNIYPNTKLLSEKLNVIDKNIN